jgi:hypothetical protein
MTEHPLNQKNIEPNTEVKQENKCSDSKTAPFSYGVTEDFQNDVERLRNEVTTLRHIIFRHEHLIAILIHEVAQLRTDSNSDSD